MKKGDLVKIQNVGIGKIVSIFDDKDINVNICDTHYYRDLETDTDVEPANKKEYINFLKFMVKQLTEKSKQARKQAAEYNKSVDGYATKKKGKVSVINGTYAFGLCENSVSSYHRGLLTDAKKAKELKNKIKQELDYFKREKEFRKSIGL